MDFWARQATARQRSRWLIVLFLLAVLAVVGTINLVVLMVVAQFGADQPVVVDSGWLRGHPDVVIVTTLAVLAVIGIANLYRTMSLAAGGGGSVARALGGQRVQADTVDPLQRRLLNVVEEMAIASGVPVPAVYVLEREDGVNAFAAGHSTANAAIAVTQGALRQLNRAELQGVIGHEFSHILNGDMRLNIRLMGLLFGLLFVAIVGRTVYSNLPVRTDSRRSGVALLAAAGLMVMAIGYVGVFFGRLIQAAVSRQREFLADASSVQFTRDTSGLRDALVKIGAVQASRLRHPDVVEVAHMLFAPGLASWFATHPPLLERIRALDPSFDASRFGDLRLEVTPQPLGVVQVLDEGGPRAFSDSEFLASERVRLEPSSVAAMVGQPGAAEVRYARSLRESLPSVPSSAGSEPLEAAAALFALVLDPNPAIRGIQLQKIRTMLAARLDELVAAQAARLAQLQPGQRLPLLGEIVPAMRRLPVADRRRILACLNALCRVDGELGIFEYAVCTLARVYIDEALDPSRRARSVRLTAATAELQVLFATLAAHGNISEPTAILAYAEGMGRLGLAPVPPFRTVPGWAGALDRALFCLDGLGPHDKARLIEALAATVCHDGTVSVAEGELLRAICAVLHCPLPPLVQRV